MNKAPVSVCIITRQDPHLEQCLASFADHVEEICIVINDHNDLESVRIADKYRAKVLITHECNDAENRIKDFSWARNKSLELATQPWIMWIDSDDVLVGADKLKNIINTLPPKTALLFPYEYSYSDQGKVLCRHYRERLAPRGTTHFVNPIHEVMVPIEPNGVNFVVSEELTFKHQRQYNPKPSDPLRNLRILKEHVAAHPDDVRNMYYIGLEYANTGDPTNAIKYLTMYIDKSGWDDERAMAAYKLVEIYQGLNDYKTALTWAFKSLEIKDWFESYFAICRTFYFLKDWKRCAHYGSIGDALPDTKTFLFINETDRFNLHVYLNVALNNLGQVAAALESCNKGLIGNPHEQTLLHNKRIYERYVGTAKVEEVVEKELNPNKLDIVFVTGPSMEQWDPESVKVRGIGGSETMLINQAKNLAALGHKVTVYASPLNPGTFDGVEYKSVNSYGNLACDVLVVSRFAPMLSDELNVKSKLTLLWLHDVCAISATNSLLLKADKILCLSEWHKQNVIRVHNVHPEHVLVTRNGIDLSQFTNIQKIKYRCLNSSSPDRSWPVLLDMWPEIKRQVPEAELHLFYGFDNWRKSAINDKLQTDLINRIEKQVTETPGVVYHGRVSEAQLTQEFMKASAWLYPTWFTETSCISAMQAQAAGCHIITSPIAALKETCADYDKTTFIEGEWTSKQYQDKFITATVKALNEKL